jgi:hypothetical protein
MERWGAGRPAAARGFFLECRTLRATHGIGKRIRRLREWCMRREREDGKLEVHDFPKIDGGLPESRS